MSSRFFFCSRFVIRFFLPIQIGNSFGFLAIPRLIAHSSVDTYLGATLKYVNPLLEVLFRLVCHDNFAIKELFSSPCPRMCLQKFVHALCWPTASRGARCEMCQIRFEYSEAVKFLRNQAFEKKCWFWLKEASNMKINFLSESFLLNF